MADYLLLLGLAILFTSVIIIKQYNIDGLVSVAIVFLVFVALIYANFGQYLATISLSNNQIEINYILPWNKPFVFQFDKITTFEYRKLHFESYRERWYVGGNWLMLKNEKGEICQFKYTINDSDDNRLIEELSKLCSRI